MAADPLDWLTAEEARAAVNLEPTDTTHDAILELWVTAVSRLLEAITGPVVSRALATCAANVATVALDLDAATTERAMLELEPGRLVTIGTDVDPYAVAGPRKLTSSHLTERRVTISGEPITTADTDTIRAGSVASTADVDRQHKLAASEALRSAWAIGQGSGTLGDPFAQQVVIPEHVWTMLAGLHRPGFGR